MNCSSSFLRIIVTFGLLLTITSSFSQNATVDSLLDIIKLKKANAETYNQLAYEHWFIDINKSKEFASKAFELASEEKNDAQVGFAYNRLGTAYLYLKNLDSAQIFYNKSAEVFEKQKMYTELAGATACCARIFETKFEYDSAINKYTQALKIFEMAEKSEYYVQTLIVVGGLYSKLGDFTNAQIYFNLALDNTNFLKPYDLITLYNKIGINYQNLGDFPDAIRFFEKAFKICDLSDNNLALANTYVNVGNLYVAWGKNEAALNYLEKGLEISKSTGIEYYCQTILLLMADIYLESGQINKAKSYYTNLLVYTNQPKDDFNEAKAYNGLAKISQAEQNYDEAKNYALKALTLFEKTQRPLYIANSHFLLAENYLLLKELGNAKKHLDLATHIAELNSLKELQAQIALLWARYNNIAKGGGSSFEYYEQYITLKDSLFAKQNQKLLAKFQVELDNLEKDFQLKEAENLYELKEIELTHKKRQIIYGAIMSLLLLLGVFVFATMYINKKRANRILFLKNKELLAKEGITQKRNDGFEVPELLQNEIVLKLNREIEENKIHLSNNLTLYSLSKILGTNSSYLSKIIQSNYNSNFSTYLNKCRILDAQKMILGPKFNNYTIDAISHECGYNSKSTFNKAFKEFTGLTPKEFKRQDTL